MIYQSEIVKGNPGVGNYSVNEKRKSSPEYSMRLVLSRFNEKDK